jgi:hypothetical protein
MEAENGFFISVDIDRFSISAHANLFNDAKMGVRRGDATLFVGLG